MNAGQSDGSVSSFLRLEVACGRPACQGCAGVVPSRPTSTSSRGLHQKCKLQLSDATKLQVGPNALSVHEAPRIAELWLQTALCNSCSCEAKISGPGSEDPIGMGPDSAESVRTAMTKTIIREIQLEKLLIRCLFSESWRVIRKNQIWDGKKRFFFMGRVAGTLSTENTRLHKTSS